MRQFQSDFLDFVVDHEILKFGEFTLKSGRVSPYFFNAGLFNTGEKIAFLANSYADAIASSGLDFDVLFGPAYKGIPLATATSMALATNQGINKPFCFNRKEAKDHGEGGTIVGAALTGKTLVIDDVITAGTAIREVMTMVELAGGEAVGVVIGLDRKERGTSSKSAIQEVEKQFSIPVISIIDMDDILTYLKSQSDMKAVVKDIKTYRKEYGV